MLNANCDLKVHVGPFAPCALTLFAQVCDFGLARSAVMPSSDSAAAAAFIVDILVSVGVSLVTTPKPREELVGFVYSETQVDIMSDPDEAGRPWFQRAVPLGAVMIVLTIAFNVIFH